MLVIFSCPVYANITMFGEVAVQLLKSMGRSGKVPGAILADDVAVALANLQSSLDAETQSTENATEPKENDEPIVSLRHRALPLIELLKAAASAQCNIMWDSVDKTYTNE